MGGGRCRLILFLLPSRSSRLVLLPLTRRAVGREETGAQANNCPLWDTRSSHSTKVGSVDTSTTERSVPLSGKKHQKSRLQQTASFGYATPQWAAKFDWLPPAGVMADLSFSVFFPVADSIFPNATDTTHPPTPTHPSLLPSPPRRSRASTRCSATCRIRRSPSSGESSRPSPFPQTPPVQRTAIGPSPPTHGTGMASPAPPLRSTRASTPGTGTCT